MKSKQLITLVVVALIVVVIGILVRSSRDSSWSGETAEEGVGTVLPDFPVNDIRKIEVSGSDGTVTIELSDSNWVVVEKHGYPAKFDTLRDFLVNLSELRAAQNVKIGASQYGRLKLVAPGNEGDEDTIGTQAVFFAADGKKIASVIFGRNHEKKSDQPNPMGGMGGGSWPDGRYLLIPDTGKVVLVSETFSNVEDDPTRWIDKEFFKVGDVKEAQLETDGNIAWKVSREQKSGDLKLEGDIPAGKEVDTSKLNSIKSAFSWASFNDVVAPETSAEETGMDKPKVYTAREFDGFVYRVKIGKETDDSKYYIQVEAEYDGPKERQADEGESDEDKAKKDKEFADKLVENQKKIDDVNARVNGWTYIVSKYTVDSVLKTRDELLKDKPKPKEDKKDAKGAEKSSVATEAKAE